MDQMNSPTIPHSDRGFNSDILKSLQNQVETILQCSDLDRCHAMAQDLHRNIAAMIGFLGSSQTPSSPLERSRHLTTAAIYGDLPRVQALIAAGTSHGPIAMFNAAAYGNLPITQHILNGGATDFPIVDAAFFVAAATGNLPIVQFLLTTTE